MLYLIYMLNNNKKEALSRYIHTTGDEYVFFDTKTCKIVRFTYEQVLKHKDSIANLNFEGTNIFAKWLEDYPRTTHKGNQALLNRVALLKSAGIALDIMYNNVLDAWVLGDVIFYTDRRDDTFIIPDGITAITDRAIASLSQNCKILNMGTVRKIMNSSNAFIFHTFDTIIFNETLHIPSYCFFKAKINHLIFNKGVSVIESGAFVQCECPNTNRFILPECIETTTNIPVKVFSTIKANPDTPTLVASFSDIPSGIQNKAVLFYKKDYKVLEV